MKKATIKKSTMSGLLLTSVLLTGCGGGGSTSTVANPATRQITSFENLASQTPAVNATNGNIIISSARTSGLGVETSKTGLTFTQVAGGENVSFDNADSETSETLVDGTIYDREYSKTLANGEIFVASETISYGPEADDYLSLGFWIYGPNDSAAAVEHGLWVGGGDVFTAGNIAALEGTASYAGAMPINGGLAIDKANTDAEVTGGYLFAEEVNLIANFDTNMISGSVTNIKSNAYGLANGAESVSGSLILEAVDMSSGSWTDGIVSSTGLPNGGVATGKWGGQFYGNGGNVIDNKPDYVAGLINGTITKNSGNDVLFSGGFRAQQSSQP